MIKEKLKNLLTGKWDESQMVPGKFETVILIQATVFAYT